MSDVLIRDVDSGDLDLIRAAAAAEGISMQQYLARTVHDQARHLRRADTLAGIAGHLEGRAGVTRADRQAVLGAMSTASDARGDELVDYAQE